MIKKRETVFLILMFLGLSGLSLAQEPYGFEVGAYGGQTYWPARSFQVGPPQSSPPIQLGFRYEDKPVLGCRVNLLSQGLWGGELDYSYQKNTVSLTRQSFTPVKLAGGIHQFLYNTVLYPMRYRNSG